MSADYTPAGQTLHCVPALVPEGGQALSGVPIPSMMMFALVLLLSLASGAISRCSPYCRCEGGDFARCTSRELADLRHFRWNRFGRNMSLLYMDNISASVVPANAFQSSDLKSLKEMKLINSRVQKLHSTAFSSLSELRILDLQNNLIYYLPKHTFKNNVNLKVLRLNNNKLMNMSFTNVPHNLRTLQLEYNRFTKIGKLSFCSSNESHSKLEKLVLHHNQINRMARSAFFCLKNLMELDLSHNKLIVLSGTMFQQSKVLQIVRANNNHILEVKSLWVLPSVIRFDFRNNQIETLKKHVFGRRGNSTSNLRSINLQNNRIRSLGDDCIFSHLKNLNQLILSGNRIESIGERVFKRNRQLIYLDVRGNPLKNFSFVDERRTVLIK